MSAEGFRRRVLDILARLDPAAAEAWAAEYDERLRRDGEVLFDADGRFIDPESVTQTGDA